MSAVMPDIAESSALSGISDPRLVAWRAVFLSAAGEVLRRYRGAWSTPGLDEAGRAVAAVGVIHPQPRSAMHPLPNQGPFAELVSATGIHPAEEAVLAIAWWSMVDPQFAVVCGCLHDDSSRRYPSLSLLAALVADVGVEVPLALDDHHRLVATGLIQAAADPDGPLRLPQTTVAAMTGMRAAAPAAAILPRRLAAHVTAIAALLRAEVPVIVRCAVDEDRTVIRDAVAARLGLPVAPTARPAPVAQMLMRLGLELPAVLLTPGEAPPQGTVLALGAPEDAGPPDWHIVEVAAPDLCDAEVVWNQALRRHAVAVSAGELSDLAGRLALSEQSITALVERAAAAAAAVGTPVTVADISAALRAHPRHDPGGLARRQPATTTLADLVLPPATTQALAEFVAHARFSPAAHEQMGLVGARGTAVIALFHGASGTGKTAAAEAVAAALDRDLWVVDLAKVVSKWLGETQRHLDTVLREAATAGAVLLFDEADGLFGRRGEVSDARDRYANLEIDHLLQRVEVHTGVVILTSNRPSALDEAFARRIRLSIRFDLPNHGERERIWRYYLPGVDTSTVAREELSGATIRAAALAATISAMAAGTQVLPEHLERAVRRELEKNRRPPTTRSIR